jgi:hypothetical protein
VANFKTLSLPVINRTVICFVWVCNLVAYIEGGTMLRVFENRLLRGIFGPKRDEVTRELEKTT